ncbi:MAG TPA: (2Fe-2S)-binding protein [Spirochaetia bacterium]
MIRFRLNGRDVEVEAEPLARLLDVLRDQCNDTSVKEGCGEGECGACLVLRNGEAVNSCILPAAMADGSEIVTMAGLRETERGRVLVEAFATEGAVQCGFCTPGMVIAADALLRRTPSPDEAQIREGISGNLCRCTGYDLIVRAVTAAARNGRGLW